MRSVSGRDEPNCRPTSTAPTPPSPFSANGASRWPGTLSGGQQRLLSLAKVLVVPSKVLVADELSLGLAPVIVDQVYEGLLEINRNGTALVVVEQQVHRALKLATLGRRARPRQRVLRGRARRRGDGRRSADGAARRGGRHRRSRGRAWRRDRVGAGSRQSVRPRQSSHERDAGSREAVHERASHRRRRADDVRQARRIVGQLAPGGPARLRADVVARADRRRPRTHRRRHRRLRDPGRRAEHEPGPQRLGLGGAAADRAGDDGRPPVRLVPAGSALRRRRRGGRALRPRDRVRRRGDEPGAVGVERPRRDGAVPALVPRGVDGRLWTQFRVSQVLADRYGITREEMDAYALESHRRAAESWDSGHFEREAIAGADQGRGRQPDRRVPAGRRGHPPHAPPSRSSPPCRRRRAGSPRRPPLSRPATRRR